MKKLIFLGTAGDTEVMASQRRASGGIVLQLDGEQFHLDPGPGSLNRAAVLKVNLRDTIGVIATNPSILRSGDVPATVAVMTMEGLDKHGVLLAHREVLEGIPQVVKEFVEGIVPLTEGSRIGVNQTTFNIYETDTLALRITHGNVDIGYTGDTSFSTKLATAMTGCKLLIINCRHPSNAKEVGYLNVDEVAALLQHVKPEQAIITGFGEKLLREDEKSVARELQQLTKIQVTAAMDGMSVDLGK